MSNEETIEYWNCLCIRLTQGQHTLLEVDDYDLIRGRSICASRHRGGFYHAIVSLSHSHSISLHRLLLNAQKGQIVDHINHDPLDNRRSNLRICNAAESAQNCRKQRTSGNRYKGVFRCPSSTAGKWGARIKAYGKLIHLGTYWTEEDAAVAYNAAAIEHHGAFACLNVLPAGHQSRGLARRLRGEETRRSRLSEMQVKEAVQLRGEGWSWNALADRYGVAQTTIRHAVSGKNWAHLKIGRSAESSHGA